MARDFKLTPTVNGVLVAAPTVVVKAADETVTNSATLQDDDELLFTVPASEKWVFEFFINYDGPATADISVTITASQATDVFVWEHQAYTTTNAFNSIGDLASGSGAAFGAAASPTAFARLSGYIDNSSTANIIKLRWGQNVANGFGTTVHAGSRLIAQRVG